MPRREQAKHFSSDKIVCMRSACAIIYKAQGRRRYKHRDQRERCAVPNTGRERKNNAHATRGAHNKGGGKKTTGRTTILFFYTFILLFFFSYISVPVCAENIAVRKKDTATLSGKWFIRKNTSDSLCTKTAR